MSSTFYSGPGWQQSSEPILTRKVHIEDNDDVSILWPLGGSHDTLTDGEHPVLAFGPKANRPKHATGVVVSYDSDTEIAVVDFADKKIIKAYVANILTYDAGNDPATWLNAVQPGDPVYVDDNAHAAGAGVTLSFSPAGLAGAANPLAGYVFWCQDEYKDSAIGGPNSTQGINQPAADDTTEALTLCVMQVNDYGYQEAVVF
jgi:hypothetical protein